MRAASLDTEPLSLAWGFEQGLKGLHRTLSKIQDFLGDVDQKQDQAREVEGWMEKFKDVAHDADDLIGETIRRKRIKKINKYLVDLESEASSIRLVPKKIVPAPQEMRGDIKAVPEMSTVSRKGIAEDIVETLINSTINEENLSVMAIVGMLGLGKTTLAKLIYNYDDINRHFDWRIWMRLSRTFDVNLVFRRMLEFVDGRRVFGIQSDQEAVLKSLQEQLAEKRCLFILDDVWDDYSAQWENFMRCLSGLNLARGSTIVVTTRSAEVAAITATLPPHYLKTLSHHESMCIFKESFPPDQQEKIEEIVQRCKGLPLLLTVLRSMLRFDHSVLDKLLSDLQTTQLDSAEGTKAIMISVLKLWFDNLQSPFLKQCFAYCSMLEEYSEIEKDNLIQLWMAQELLHPSPENGGLQMEDIGNEFFNNLLEGSLLEGVAEDERGVVTKCTFHDVVRDFTEEVSKSESLTRSSYELHERLEIRHVAYVDTSVLEGIQKRSVRRLRSLFSNGEVPINMLPSFRALLVLNLYEADIQKLPISIDKLKQLRYLNVSRTDIEELPKTIGKLHNLQTLRMQHCRNLKVFPKEVGDLVSLRHIYFDLIPEKRHVIFGWYREFPVGIGQLTNIRTIPYFIVGRDQMGNGIEELAGLNQLNGELIIYDLEHVRDGEEAKKANLAGKRNIWKLTLVWSEERRLSNHYEEEVEVLEGLQPHSKLEILEIHNFMGAKFPSWKPLENLKKIRLRGCEVCEEIPILGHLTNLMHLEFDRMCNLKNVGVEVDRYKDGDGTGKRNALFPALKTFRICTAPNLIELVKAPEMPTEQVSLVSVFPCLEELALLECTQLRSISNHLTSLRRLEISMCHELSNLPSVLEKCSSLEILEISSCDNVTSISTHGLTCLRKLVISSCCGLTSMDLKSGSESLKELSIKWCRSLESFPTLHRCTSLLRLTIADCDGLISIAHCGLETLILKELTIRNCPNLEFIPITQGILCLRKLVIEGCRKMKISGSPNLTSIPASSSLTELILEDCTEIRSLPVGLESVQELRIGNCTKLTSISTESLISLRKLVIASCGPELYITSSTVAELSLHGGTSLYSQGIPSFKNISGDEQQTSISLEELKLVGCPKLEELYLHGCTSLCSLCIERCQNLRHFSANGLHYPISLKELKFIGCPNLEKLSLHGCTSLQELAISDCQGLASTGQSGLDTFSHLKKLIIRNCRNLELIPIPCLQHLVIEGFEKLSSLPIGLGSCSSLQKLEICDCPNLISLPISDIILPPSLLEFVIESCSQLSSLQFLRGNSESLKELSISNCPKLTSIDGLDKLSLVEELTIRSCPSLEFIPITEALASLRILRTEDCEKVSSLPSALEYCSALQKVKISGCPNLKSLLISPSLTELVIDDCAELSSLDCAELSSLDCEEYSLQELIVGNCPKLTCISLDSLTSLGKLVIKSCGPEMSISAGNALEELAFHGCASLHYLSITKCQTLRVFSGDHMISLEQLDISGCPKLKAIPNLHNLTSLRKLSIAADCEGLTSLPSGLSSCTSPTNLF